MNTGTLKYKSNTQGAHRFTMYLFIITTSMTFAGFTSAFIVQKGKGGAWTSFNIPIEFLLFDSVALFSFVNLIRIEAHFTLLASGEAGTCKST